MSTGTSTDYAMDSQKISKIFMIEILSSPFDNQFIQKLHNKKIDIIWNCNFIHIDFPCHFSLYCGFISPNTRLSVIFIDLRLSW